MTLWKLSVPPVIATSLAHNRQANIWLPPLSGMVVLKGNGCVLNVVSPRNLCSSFVQFRCRLGAFWQTEALFRGTM